jgi:hypothetical protein
VNAIEQELEGRAVEFAKYTAADMLALGARLQRSATGAPTRQAVAQRMVELLYAELRAERGSEPACVLVRCFQTAPFAQLPVEYQYAAEESLAQTASDPELRCLALLATVGERQVWNDVATSVNHQSIPLPSMEVVRRAPMISRLLEQIGVPEDWLAATVEVGRLGASTMRVEETSGHFNVFHIEEAEGSPYIPAQAEFVQRYGVRSVVGVGGLLPDGELFVVILFTRVAVSRELAEMFRTLAESVRLAVVTYDARETFRRNRDVDEEM